MNIYRTLATYALVTVPLLFSQSCKEEVSPKIDGYKVTAHKITKSKFPSLTTWEDTNGDGEFDKKKLTILTRRSVFSIEQTFQKSDKKLTDNLVARLK